MNEQAGVKTGQFRHKAAASFIGNAGVWIRTVAFWFRTSKLSEGSLVCSERNCSE